MQHLNVFPKYLQIFPFQYKFSGELGMDLNWKGKNNWHKSMQHLNVFPINTFKFSRFSMNFQES